MTPHISWQQFKALIAGSTALTIQYVENSISYEMCAYNGTVRVAECDLLKMHEDCVEFETLYKPTANKFLTIKSQPFSEASGFRLRGASMGGTVSANTTVDIDYKIVQERYINGGRLIVDNIGPNDSATFQVIDKDNVLGFGANTVLDEFITEFAIPYQGTLEVKQDYPARLPAGVYIRIKYTSTHASGANVRCNLFLHWKQA